MKAAVYTAIGQIELKNIDTPKINDDELLVKVEMCGICGTDIKTFLKGHHMFTPPCILGHEFVGKVAETGKNISKSFGASSYVFAPYIECEKCETCIKGAPELCKNKYWIDGAFTEYVKVPVQIAQRAMFEVPQDCPKETATLTEPLACAIHGINRARITCGNKVLVVGSGPMGLLICLALKKMNCDVLTADVDRYRIDAAKNCGIDTKDFSGEKFEEFRQSGISFDSVILANDQKDLVNKLLPLVKPCGTLELFGGMPKNITFEADPYYVHYRQVDIVGSFGFSEKDFRKAFTVISENSQLFSRMISQKVGIKDIKKGFELATDRKNIKVVVKISE